MSKILIRCDAGKYPEIGTGHLSRCIQIARELVSQNLVKKNDIIFLTRNEKEFSLGKSILSKTSIKFLSYKNEILKPNSLSELTTIINHMPQLVIIDRLKTHKKFILGLKSKNIKVISFDDYGSGRLVTDLSICAIFDDIKKNSNIIKGFKYLTLKGDKANLYIRKSVKKIVATFGGYDSRNLCKFFLLNSCFISQSIKIDLILGDVNQKQVNDYNKIIKKIGKDKCINLFINPKDFTKKIYLADLAICSGGLSIYDLALSRTPTVSIPQYKHQLKTIIKLDKLNITKMGTRSMQLNNSYFQVQVDRLIKDFKLRQKMVNASRKHIDGQGLYRVIKKISEFI